MRLIYLSWHLTSGNNAPNITGESKISVNKAEEFVLTLNVEDADGDEVTVAFTGAPESLQSGLQKVSSNEWTFTWTPTTSDPVELQ